jgi:hypothetical protein
VTLCLSFLATAASDGWMVLPLGWFLLIMAVAHMVTRLRAASVVESSGPLAWVGATIGLDLLLLLAFLFRPDFAVTPSSWVAITADLHERIAVEAVIPMHWAPMVELILLPMVVITDVVIWAVTEALRHGRSRLAHV